MILSMLNIFSLLGISPSSGPSRLCLSRSMRSLRSDKVLQLGSSLVVEVVEVDVMVGTKIVHKFDHMSVCVGSVVLTYTFECNPVDLHQCS